MYCYFWCQFFLTCSRIARQDYLNLHTKNVIYTFQHKKTTTTNRLSSANMERTTGQPQQIQRILPKTCSPCKIDRQKSLNYLCVKVNLVFCCVFFLPIQSEILVWARKRKTNFDVCFEVLIATTITSISIALCSSFWLHHHHTSYSWHVTRAAYSSFKFQDVAVKGQENPTTMFLLYEEKIRDRIALSDGF